MPTTRCRALAAGWLLPLALVSAAAVAQTPPSTEPPPQGSTAPPEEVEPGPPIGSPGSEESLGDELTRSHGVLTPSQGVDPGLVKEPPPAGATPMPVIPPPGSPGGNPDVQPQ
jgi:hypothetical protein